MIAFRNYDARFPFLWETAAQPAARWHGAGDGPVQYFADTPHGAWAEFIRHEEITEIDDLAGVHRAICAVEIDETECEPVSLSSMLLRGDESTYLACQNEAARIRSDGSRGLKAPSAALKDGGAHGHYVDSGLHQGPARDGWVFVLFGRRPDLIGWKISTDARPPAEILDQVRHLS